MSFGRACLALFAVQIAALAVVGFPAAGGGYPLDDSWIFAVIARNAAELGTWGFDPTGASSGATSTLWTAVLTANASFLQVPPLVFSHALNAAFFLLLGPVFLKLMWRERSTHALVSSVLFVGSGNVVWFAFLGMEPVLFLLLVTAAVVAIDAKSYGSFARAGGLFGLAAALRPDSIAACGATLGAFFVWTRARKQAALAMAIVALMYGLNLAVTYQLTGAAFPITLQGRRWLEQLPAHGLPPAERMLAYVGQRAAHIGTNVLALYDWPIAWFGVLLIAVLVFVAAGTVTSLRAAYAERADATGRLGHLVWFSLVHSATYLVLFPSIGHGGRYQPLAVALTLPLAFLGIEALCGASQRLPLRRAAPALQALVVVACLASAIAWRTGLREGIALINATHRTIAREVAALPPNARVASFDIGGIGYDSHRRIVDLGGLVDRKYLPALWRGEVDAYLRSNHIDYVVLPEYYAQPPPTPNTNTFYRFIDEFLAKGDSLRTRLGLARNRHVRLTPVAEASTAYEAWVLPNLLTGAAMPRQVLYAVRPGS